jgi:beta-phosphoglucomutase-like phosphatase (HAD superfamily)
VRSPEEFNALAQTELKPLPGLLALLESLGAQGVRMAVVTNAPPSEMHFGLSCLGIEERFQAFVPSAECSHGALFPTLLLQSPFR